ncbi:unnamed protein product, partial [Gulo gulo]
QIGPVWKTVFILAERLTLNIFLYHCASFFFSEHIAIPKSIFTWGQMYEGPLIIHST